MYLSEYPDDGQLGFKKLKKLARKVSAPVLKIQKKAHAAVVRIAPKPLKGILKRVSASTERATAMSLRPFDSRQLLKEERKQLTSTLKKKDVRKIAAGVLAAAAIWFTGGAAAPAVLALLKGAADRTAAKKAAAQSQAEEDAAQAEFDAYAKQLAEQSAAQPPALSPEDSSRTVRALPFFPTDTYEPATEFLPSDAPPSASRSTGTMVRGGSNGVSAPGAPAGTMPKWVLPAALGAVALFALPMLTKARR